MKFQELVWNDYINKKGSMYSAGKILRFLGKLLNKEIAPELESSLEIFIIMTDIIDDIMDKDKNLSEFTEEVSKGLNNSLNFIRKIVPKRNFALFIDSINKALLYQGKELDYILSKKSTSEDYYKLVKRSSYLIQSIVFLIDACPPQSIMEGLEHFSISAQIDNDISDLNKTCSYDLLDKKGTLPLIKFIEYANHQENPEIVENILSLNRNLTFSSVYKSIQVEIIDSGVIEYCQLVSYYHRNKAAKCFQNYRSESNMLVMEFIFYKKKV